MQKQVFAAAAILCFMVGASGLYAADIDILKKAEQTVQLPSFGLPRGKLTPATAEALARELPQATTNGRSTNPYLFNLAQSVREKLIVTYKTTARSGYAPLLRGLAHVAVRWFSHAQLIQVQT
jgi:hypothetical protein